MSAKQKLAGRIWRAIALGMFVVASAGVALSLQYHAPAHI